VKRITILHISDFGGHRKAAQNIKEALFFKDPRIKVNTLNGLGYFYPRGEKIVNFIYLLTIKYFPHLWGKAYDRQKVIKALTPCRKIVHRFTFHKLRRLINESKPDCFVATQAFPCGLVADFKESKNVKIPLVAIVTDYHPNRFWIHPGVDRYVVACQEARDVLIGHGVAQQNIEILGIPISVNFLTSYPKEAVAQELGFVYKLPSVLIMGGGLGLGPIKFIAQHLDDLEQDFQIIVVCGRNQRLYQWFLKNKRTFKKPLFIFGYTDSVDKIMDFSDIIITKGGGITISESLAKGLCIIVTNPIPGQEERNVEYLNKLQAIVRADRAETVAEVVGNILNNPKDMYRFKERAKANSFIDSSLRIVDLILELTN